MRYFLVSLLLCCKMVLAQEALHNFGNLQMHNGSQMGFHTNLINDGMFNQNLGLVGFYHPTETLSISGTEIPRFYEAEIAVDNHLQLNINTEIRSTLNYIIGDVITPRDNPDISLDFLQDSEYFSEDNIRNTDGYTAINGIAGFRFPIGHDNKLRPLILPNRSNTATFKAAYFNEDPNFPSTFSPFDTSESESIISMVSIYEFWDFNGSEATQITLTWDNESYIGDLVSNLSNLRVVGWSRSENKWKNLGNNNVTGSIAEGTITSSPFVPDNYEAITFGSYNEDSFTLGESGVVIYNSISPNGDGKNDVFYIDGIEEQKNILKIYNRWGLLVYETVNYKNNWDGTSSGRATVDKGKKLPTGTYFYILDFPEWNKRLSSWLYIVSD
ncbi:MAG: gliding motility-associated C-terminal domain-containing protein [Aestuariibaculum sp.]